MLIVSLTDKATCSIDMSDKQVVEASFKDGSFSGVVCWKCLGKMIEAREKNGGKKEDAAKISEDHSLFEERS